MSEEAFSSGEHTVGKSCNQLSAEVLEALQILKSCYIDGLIMAEEASTHKPKPFVYDSDYIDVFYYSL